MPCSQPTVVHDSPFRAVDGAIPSTSAWQRCGHVPEHAHDAVRELAGVTVAEAAEWTWRGRHGLDGDDADATDYRRWRERVREAAARVRL